MGAVNAVRIVLSAAFVLSATFTAALPASAEIVIEADYGWAYAQASCRARLEDDPKRFLACGSPDMHFEDFVLRLETQFAGNSLCRDVYIIRVSLRPKAVPAITAEAGEKLKAWHWLFWINFVIGEDTQYWFVFSSDWKIAFRGAGDPKEIAHDVCSAITERGATIVR